MANQDEPHQAWTRRIEIRIRIRHPRLALQHPRSAIRDPRSEIRNAFFALRSVDGRTALVRGSETRERHFTDEDAEFRGVEAGEEGAPPRTPRTPRTPRKAGDGQQRGTEEIRMDGRDHGRARRVPLCHLAHPTPRPPRTTTRGCVVQTTPASNTPHHLPCAVMQPHHPAPPARPRRRPRQFAAEDAEFRGVKAGEEGAPAGGTGKPPVCHGRLARPCGKHRDRNTGGQAASGTSGTSPVPPNAVNSRLEIGV